VNTCSTGTGESQPSVSGKPLKRRAIVERQLPARGMEKAVFDRQAHF
jgi:hypothetical protein